MTKALIRNIVFTFISAFIGYSLSFASTGQNHHFYSKTTTQNTENQQLEINQGCITILVSASKQNKNDDSKAITVFDDNDDEFVSLKKQLEASNYSIPMPSGHITNLFFALNKKLSPNVPTNRYLIFKIFRI